MMSNRLDFYHLTFVPEREAYIVGCPDVASYAVFPADGVALLKRLQAGASPADAAEWYEGVYGEKVDIEDFVGSLEELGFLRAEGQASSAPAPARVPLQRLGRLAFSLPAFVCYSILAISGVWLMVLHADLRPRPQNLLFVSSLIVVQLVLLVGQIPGLLWHESFHALAGRRLGVPSRLRLSRRLYFIVFETRLDGLLGVARRKRYLPFMAGLLADAVLFSVLTALAHVFRQVDGTLAWEGRLALALAYATLLRMAWQLYLCLRTDLYYVVSTALGCADLHGATMAYARNRLLRIFGRADHMVDEEAWSPRDRAVARWYAPVAGAGVVFLLGSVVVGVLPAMVEFVVRAVEGIRAGAAFGPRFWDAAVSAFLVFAQIVGLLLISFVPWIRRHRQRAGSLRVPSLGERTRPERSPA